MRPPLSLKTSQRHRGPPRSRKRDKQATVGLLGVSNIDYVVTEMTLYRMGYCSSASTHLHDSVDSVLLFLSQNNSPLAIARLLTATNASHIIVQDTSLFCHCCPRSPR